MSLLRTRKFEIVVWGATGFTGTLAAEYLTKTYGPSGRTIRYAFAGRNMKKLAQLRETLEAAVPGSKDIPLIVANVEPKEQKKEFQSPISSHMSLGEMARSTACLVTFVGPFSKYGEPVLAACVEEGTHYCDITGETAWVKKMIGRYHRAAAEKKLKIVNMCGFDSLPFDLGVFEVQREAVARYGRPCNDVRAVLMDFKTTASGGTIHSAMDALSVSWSELVEMNNPDLLVEGNDLPPSNGGRPLSVQRTNVTNLGYDAILRCYRSPFVMSTVNSKVVRRSASINPALYGRDFQYFEAMKTSNLVVHLLFTFAFFIVGMALVFLPPLRWAIKKLVPQGTGPSAAVRDNGFFKIQFVGSSPAQGAHKAANVTATVASFVGDPGYKETAKMAVEAALCNIFETKDTPKFYGVLTPAAAFGHTLAERLKAREFIITVDVKTSTDTSM